MTKKLYKSKKNKILFGVCGGIGEYFDIDPVIIRIIFILSGISFFLYFILAIIIPFED